MDQFLRTVTLLALGLIGLTYIIARPGGFMDRAGPTSTGAAVAPVTIQPPAIAPATSAALPSTDEPAEGAEPDPLLETPEAEADPALTGAAPAAEQPQPVIAGDSVTATSQPDAA